MPRPAVLPLKLNTDNFDRFASQIQTSAEYGAAKIHASGRELSVLVLQVQNLSLHLNTAQLDSLHTTPANRSNCMQSSLGND